jgi:hypothetical protein
MNGQQEPEGELWEETNQFHSIEIFILLTSEFECDIFSKKIRVRVCYHQILGRNFGIQDLPVFAFNVIDQKLPVK